MVTHLHWTYTHTLDLLKTTSRRDTETTPPHFDTHASEAILNLANISGPSKTARKTTLFHGAFFHQSHPTTAQARDATSASKKNS